MTLVFEKRVKCVFVVPQSINPARDKQNKPCSVEWRRSVPAFAVTDLSDPRNNCMLFVLFWSCWGFFFTSSSRPDERCTTAILISLFAPFKWTITTPSSCHTWRDMIHVHRGKKSSKLNRGKLGRWLSKPFISGIRGRPLRVFTLHWAR